jgi:hypothetical protein
VTPVTQSVRTDLRPACCLICGLADIQHILNDVTVTAHTESADRKVTNLAIYACMINGHIFFVRKSDMAR